MVPNKQKRQYKHKNQKRQKQQYKNRGGGGGTAVLQIDVQALPADMNEEELETLIAELTPPKKKTKPKPAMHADSRHPARTEGL